MNWFRRIFGGRVRYKKVGTEGRELRYSLDQEVVRPDFTVLIWRGFREIVEIEYVRDGKELFLQGERIGKKWEGIGISLPPELDPSLVPQILHDLESAFKQIKIHYSISQRGTPIPVPEEERSAALREMHELGYEVEILDDGRQIRQKLIPGRKPPTMEEARALGPRMMQLIFTLSGKQTPIKILAESKQFE